MRRPFLLAPIAVALALLLAPGAAHAAPDQVMTFEAPTELLDDGQREATLDEIQSFGVTRVRALAYWQQFTARPNSRRPPRFDTADHTAYPAETFGRLDRLVDSVQRRGMDIQVTLTGPVPTWATKRKRGHIKNPRPKWFGRWARAVAARYGDRVNLWSIWNEPNHPEFLGPQYKRRGGKRRPHTPRLYRRLYVAGQRAIHRVQRTDRVLFGETAPIGNQNVVSPLGFLRKSLCLNRSYRKRKSSCKKVRIDGYAHHAYTRKAGPAFVSDDGDEVSIGSLGRLSSALDRAARAGVIDRGVPIYLTEFGIQSKPDPIAGVKLRRQAEYLAIAERMAYANPRVAAYSQYLLRDDKPRGRGLERYAGFETGLRTAKGRKKPAYDAFILPLAITRYGASVVFWGRVRPATGPTDVVIQRKRGKGKWRRLTTVTTQPNGVYAARTDHAAKARYRARWKRPGGGKITGPRIRPY